jgi:hypothetical protein
MDRSTDSRVNPSDTMPEEFAMLAVSLSLFAVLFAAPQAPRALSPDEAAAVKQHYMQLGSVAIEQKPCEALPSGVNVVRVDASSRIRSASFGHSTTLLVDANAPKRYWVEYGRSTNHPAALYGPFEVH